MEPALYDREDDGRMTAGRNQTNTSGITVGHPKGAHAARAGCAALDRRCALRDGPIGGSGRGLVRLAGSCVLRSQPSRVGGHEQGHLGLFPVSMCGAPIWFASLLLGGIES